jgi:hypothetical protein
VGEIVGGLSRTSIDICDPAGDITGVCVAVRGAKAGIDAVIETVVVGPVSDSG